MNYLKNDDLLKTASRNLRIHNTFFGFITFYRKENISTERKTEGNINT